MLDVRAKLTEEEKSHIKNDKLGDTMLHERDQIVGGSELLGLASRLALR